MEPKSGLDVLDGHPSRTAAHLHRRPPTQEDRATDFGQRCRALDIEGVTLHSYRYSWAERAKVAGYPERFAQAALGHNSKAVHRAYAENAKVVLPSLGSYERKAQEQNIVPFPKPQEPGKTAAQEAGS